MARFPSINAAGEFEAPEVQDHIKQLVTAEDVGITVDTSVGTKIEVGGHLVAYESGLRDIMEYVDPEWTSLFSAQLARSGNQVSLWFVNFSKGESLSGNHRLLTLPIGFRPPTSTYAKSHRNVSVYITQSGVVSVISPSGSVDSVHFSFITLDPPSVASPGNPG